MRAHVVVVIVIVLAAAVAQANAANGDKAPVARVPGRALLKLKGFDDGAALHIAKATDPSSRAIAELGKRHGLRLSFVKASLFGWVVVDVRVATDPARVPDEAHTLRLVEQLATDDVVDLAADEGWMRKLATPNDRHVAAMWHLDQIGAKAAWDVTTGVSSQRIGVADTGVVRSHEDLSGRIVAGFDFISDRNAGNDGNGRDADFNDAGDSCNGTGNSFHGTHTAGTMAAAANNSRGTAGMNWQAGLVVARVLGRCGGSTVDIMEGAAWMAGARINGVSDVGANKVSVMNLSLGGGNRCSSYEQQMVDFINNQGVVFVAAAGNDGGAVGSPANCNGAVAVAATGPSNRLASYSSFGSQIAIVAPGGDNGGGVLSTIGPGNADYSFSQGTSMAAPHVAGAVSLVQALRPAATRTEIVNLLRQTGAVCTGCQGVPALRIGAAIAALGGAQTPPAPPSSPPPASGLRDDAFEDNDNAGQAKRATCGVDDGRPVALAGDQDWFRFTPPQGRRLAIAIDGGAVDLDLYVLDSTGQNILARSEGNSGVERITGTAGGGTLMVLINPYTDQNAGVAHQGPYRLSITCGQMTTQSTTDFEAGDPFEDVLGELEEGSELGDVDAIDDQAAAVVDVEAPPVLDDGDISVSGGCSAIGIGAGPLALLGLLLRRRRRGAGGEVLLGASGEKPSVQEGVVAVGQDHVDDGVCVGLSIQ